MENLQFFQSLDFVQALKMFFGNLQVPVNYIEEKPARPEDVLGSQFNVKKEGLELMDDVYVFGMVDDLAFTHTASKITNKEDLAIIKKDYDGLLIFGVTLKKRKDGLLPTRTHFAEITRAFNRAFPHMPVTVIFKYSNYISLANAERQAYKSESKEGEKIGKVIILKDVSTSGTHRGHLDILAELTIPRSGSKAVTTFKQLYSQWQKVLSTQTLNKRFYQELFHWYLWAKKHIEIPAPPKSEKQDKETLTSIFSIRLLTRLLFVWFVKEKKLIPNEAFDEDYISEVLKKFDPDGTLTAMGKKEEGSYYKAILQNLFFATLNTPMDKDPAGKDERRQFIDESKGKSGYNDQHLDQTKYRHGELLKDSKVLMKLFKEVPFLNGGLFECLDYKEADGTDKRYDGFSVTKSKQALVPDVLFFSPASEEDLSADFDNDTKMKRVRIRGLIKIFDSYKFTIAENTPLEEEIALDPELLGKVFENLLASYNPETKTTARKQTGSFYTPREIVNYMVDESLKAYLLQKQEEIPEAYVEAGKVQPDMFGNNHRKGQLKIETPVVVTDEKKQKKLQQSLDQLFNDAQPQHAFSADQCKLLIEAISNCRILDPACGSGAFPMGILHRMVSLLSTLDPYNKAWKEAQLKKAQADLKRANGMEDATIRENAVAQAEQRIEYIKESFGNPKHEFDYTRKLFLIENCIYGVDIQQIAVQIAKLRFFISLMSEQQVDDSRPNRNILSMPNLETKFVAANTLIALEKNVSSKKGTVGLMELRSENVKKLELELKDLRKQIFFTRSYKQKKKLKLQEKALREKLKVELIQSSWGEKSAAQAAEWDPFDQMHYAPFYDTETMFGFTDGFDVVIGNPPYVNVANLDNFHRSLYKSLFTVTKNKSDVFAYFIETGEKLLSQSGTLSLIIPHTWKATVSFSKLRELIFTKFQLKKIVELEFGTFEAIVKPVVVILKHGFNNFYSIDVLDNSFSIKAEVDIDEVLQHPEFSLDTTSSNSDKLVFKKIEEKTTPLGQVLQFSRGIKTSNDERFLTFDKPSSNGKKIFRGRNIKAFELNWNGEYIWYQPDLMREKVGCLPHSKEFFEVPEKLVTQRVNSSFKLLVAYDTEKNYFLDTTNVSNYKTWNKNLSMKYLCALLNSKLINFWYSNKYRMPTISSYELEAIPIKFIALKKQVDFEILVDKIILNKNEKKNTLSLQDKVDKMVYSLYSLSYDQACIIEGNKDWMSKEAYEEFSFEGEKEVTS